ncbi:septum formation initiator [Alteraurantiacibacter aquimixticola]|uniref:Septum formation initiator n=1 Tax=Alteraurantiacibacter aquimixticola TaxID=2489173 RepID=A0A4T3EZE1_9SPHN|nr:septum formation initiator [Alteraurantiacibacter aquimixticola]TIX50129.1 septum formation initiator [Alteraurantiacibacter aquimixticola]
MNAPVSTRDKRIQYFALAWLLLLGTLALAGPYGLLSWSEQSGVLEMRAARIAALQDERAVLANRVELLDPDNVDPDLASELLRHNLNVAHRDEYVVELDDQR